MKYLIFFLGYLTGKIVTDIQFLKEVKNSDRKTNRKIPRIYKQERTRGNDRRIQHNERIVTF